MSAFKTPIPTNTDWTLLFKFHKTTLILPIAPTDSIAAVQGKLFTALASTPNFTQINGEPLPNSAGEIQLAILNKASDASSGWKRVDDVQEHEAGSAAAGSGGGAGVVTKDSVKGLGLKESGILAFRFGQACQADEWPVRFPSFEDMDQVQQQAADEDIPGLADALGRTAGAR